MTIINSFIQDQQNKTRLKTALPGEQGLPLLGHSFNFLYRPVETALRLEQRYGPIFWINILGMPVVVMLGPEANKLILLDREKIFSNSQGWDFFIGRFFKRGIMLLDFDEHRLHRSIMQQAFKKSVLVQYLEQMNPIIDRNLLLWERQRGKKRFLVFPQLKQLTLDIATQVFMGETLGHESRAINKAFIECVQAGTALVRYPVPGGRWHKGIKARKKLEQFFHSRIAVRRSKPGPDLFSQLCLAEDENGQRFSDNDVVNHMIFLLMAAHDTSTLTLSGMFYYLAKNPFWQSQLRTHSENLQKHFLDFDDLAQLTDLENVIKETLRLIPPVHGIPRRTQKETNFNGFIIPNNTFVIISPYVTHHMEQYWQNAEQFNPNRFTQQNEHPFQYIPFGGGAHKCIGMHFADLQIKAIMHQILLRFSFSVPSHYKMPINFTSLPSPADGLPISLS